MIEDKAAAGFWSDGYRIVDALVTPKQCTFLRQAMDRSRDAGKMRVADHRAYRGPNNQYAPIPAQMFLASLNATMSALVGRKLLPSFSFWRIYQRGDVLNRHKDRNACEVSVTISLTPACDDDRIWPIGVTDLKGHSHSINLPLGSGLLYLGTEVDHWRDPLTVAQHYQMFLHYVVADGPFAALEHDEGKARVP
jgi:alkylated DNA repair dioxygenase AlkB